MQKLFASPFYRNLLLFAAALHLCAAWFSEGFNKGIVNIGNDLYILYPESEVLTEGFEYNLIIRSAFQSLIGYAFWQILPDNHNTPFTVAFLTRLLSAVLAFFASLAFFLAYQNDIKTEPARRWFFAALFFCWVLLFFHVRFSADGWLVSFLFLALAALRWRYFFAAGLLCGLAFAVRYQAGFVLLPLGLWILFFMRPGVRNIILLLASGSIILAAEFAVNWWFYGKPILPWLNYFLFFTDGTTIPAHETPSLFFIDEYAGAKSPFLYWQKAGEYLPPVGYLLPPLLAVFWVKFPRHELTWATALFAVFHALFSYREIQYMYPMLAFMPFITAMVWESTIQQKAKLKIAFLWILKISAVINAPLLLFIALYPATVEVKLLRQCILPMMHKDGLTTYLYYGEKASRGHNVALGFYYRDLPVEHVADESELMAKMGEEKTALYVSRRPRAEQLEESGLEYERVCSAIPDWALRYNFNNWTARASIYPVYRVVK